MSKFKQELMQQFLQRLEIELKKHKKLIRKIKEGLRELQNINGTKLFTVSYVDGRREEQFFIVPGKFVLELENNVFATGLLSEIYESLEETKVGDEVNFPCNKKGKIISIE